MNEINTLKTKEVAELLGVTSSFVSQLKSGHKKVPLKMVTLLHETYGIPLWELRPDVYPRELFESKP